MLPLTILDPCEDFPAGRKIATGAVGTGSIVVLVLVLVWLCGELIMYTFIVRLLPIIFVDFVLCLVCGGFLVVLLHLWCCNHYEFEEVLCDGRREERTRVGL